MVDRQATIGLRGSLADPLPNLPAWHRARRRPIGIGGRLATPPLPHHRAYGSVPRRFGGLRASERHHGEQPMIPEAFVAERTVQRARRTQPPRPLRAVDGRPGHPLGDVQTFEFLVAPAVRLPLDPDNAAKPSSCPAIE